MMRSIFSSRRQSTIQSSSSKSESVALPLPPQKPPEAENQNSQNMNQEKTKNKMPKMEVFASKLEETCRSLLTRFEGVTTWALSVCTVDGKRVALGDFSIPDGDPPISDENYFPLNELCYLLNYCLACETLGEATLKKYFASRPIPRDRDEFSLHPDGKAWNPLCRTGGLLLSSLLYPDLDQNDRLAKIHEYYRKVSVDCSICCDNLSYNLKRLHSHGEIGLAHYLAFYERYPPNTHLDKTLDLYFQLCSTAITPDAAAIIAATLANGGQCPFTEEKLIPPEVVQNALSQILHACSADKSVHAECEKYGIWLANRSGAGFLIIPGVLGLSFSLEGASNQQSAKVLRLVVQKVRQLIKIDDARPRKSAAGGSSS